MRELHGGGPFPPPLPTPVAAVPGPLPSHRHWGLAGGGGATGEKPYPTQNAVRDALGRRRGPLLAQTEAGKEAHPPTQDVVWH